MKKILATFLALVMVLSSLCLPAVAVQDLTNVTADVTLTQADFAVDTNDYDQDGNTTEWIARDKIEKALAAAPYTMVDKEVDGETVQVRSYTLPNIVLGSDVTIAVDSNTVFPLLADNFYGNFYGNGNSITFTGDIALKFNTGDAEKGVLFDTVGINDTNDTDDTSDDKKIDATIYDLTVKGVKATVSDGTATGSQFGTIAGSTAGAVTMNNVHVEADLTKNSTGNTNVGGLIGKTNNTANFIDCSFNGTIGYTESSGENFSAGGIAGGAVNTITIQSCTVNKENQTNGEIKGCTRAGGLIGALNTSKVATIKMQTEVYGKVTAITSAGGFIATVEGSGTVNMSRSGADDSPTNYAAVTSTSNIAGGIIGKIVGKSTATITPRVTLNMIFNKGTVTGANSTAGGMIGHVELVALATDGNYNICIKNSSMNTGDVTGKNFVGGVIGRLKGSGAVVQIDNFTNEGKITANTAFAGGVIGISDGTGDTLKITDTINLGAVSGANSVGGILGRHRTDAAKSIAITGCVNIGAVTTTNAQDSKGYAGGIVGDTYYASTKVEISDCWNFASVTNTNTKTPTYVGGIYGNLKETGDALTVANNIDFTAAASDTNAETVVKDSALIAMGEEGKAQMRYSNTLTAAGIRFKIDTNSALLTALTNAGYTYTLGSLMATKETVEAAGGVLTKEALTGKKYSDVNTHAVVKNNQYAVAINNIGQANYATDFQCAGYITLTKGDLTFTIYTEASEARSVAYIADAILDANTETDAIAKYGTALNTFAAALATE